MDGKEFDMNGAADKSNRLAGQDGADTKDGNAGRKSLAGLSGSNLVLVVLFAAGIAGVYLLSLRGGPAKSSAEQQAMELKVDTALTQLKTSRSDGKQGRKGLSILDTSYYDMKQRQVAADNLRSNPFVFALGKAGVVKTGGPAGSGFDESRSSEKLQEMQLSAQGLKLQSVLVGRHGATAMISNNLISEGQIISGWRVAKIRPRQVVLTWKEHKHLLTIED